MRKKPGGTAISTVDKHNLAATELPLVIDIKRYSFEDGPGIRSVVFFKGCPLKCVFCHNPEAQETAPEIAFSIERCVECGACVQVCPLEAVDFKYPGRIRRAKCNRCGKCAELCPTDALRLIGKPYSAESLRETLLRDYEYYRYSGGGVTLSGGECTLFPEYLEALLKSLKASGIHIVLETSGYFDYRIFRKKIYPHLDLIYYDIKFVDNEIHKRYCGRPNRTILGNLRRLIEEGGVQVQPRIPLIPGITATKENLCAIANFLGASGFGKAHLLPYNPLGLAKCVTLGRPTPDLPASFMKPEEERRAYDLLKIIPKFAELVVDNNFQGTVLETP
jgi:pyruvate formate lyase activating enzyme